MSRTPFPITKNARRGANGAQDSEIPVPKAPKAPKVPTVPPIMHEPTSPSPMARSRRGISQSYHVQATLNHGIRRDQQQHRRTTADNGVEICEQDHKETKARRPPMIGPDTQRRPSITIPLQHPKRHLEDGVDDSDETRLKHRRIVGDLGRGLIQAQIRDDAPNAGSRVYGAKTQGIVDGPTRDGQMELIMDENTAVSGSTPVRNVDDDRSALRKKSGLLELAPLSLSRVMEGLEAEADRLDDVGSDEEDGARIVPEYIKTEMQKFEQGFNGLDGKFKLLNKIGEGEISIIEIKLSDTYPLPFY